MEFIFSISDMRENELKRLLSLWKEKRNDSLFEKVLVSPLFCNDSLLALVKKWKQEEYMQVYFDSGAFQCHKGSMEYTEFFDNLLETYKKNTWADFYVLPDIIPYNNSLEAGEKASIKTIRWAIEFYNKLPNYLQNAVIPVIQGTHKMHIKNCLSFYREMGFRYIGIGGFAQREWDSQVEDMVYYLRNLTRNTIEEIHVFGVGSLPVLSKIKNFSTVDSTNWHKAAIFNSVLFPFSGQKNLNTELNEDEFYRLKKITGHSCPFCEDYKLLFKSRDLKTLHNIVATKETASLLETFTTEEINKKIKVTAPSFYNKFLKTNINTEELFGGFYIEGEKQWEVIKV